MNDPVDGVTLRAATDDSDTAPNPPQDRVDAGAVMNDPLPPEGQSRPFSPMRLLAATLAGVSTATTISLLLAMFFGTLTTTISALSLGAGLIAGVLTYRYTRGHFDLRLSLSSFDYLMIFLFILFCVRQFFWLYMYKSDNVMTVDPFSMGDLPSHIMFTQYFANGTKFWPENPMFPGEKFHYHFGMDLFGALFVRIGIPIDTVLSLVGFTLGLATLTALLYWGGGFTVAGFLFSGGITAFAWLTGGTLKEHLTTSILPWLALPTTLLVAQRAFLFAFPCGLFLLWSWRRRFVLRGQDATDSVSLERAFPLALEGLLWGTLPLFHVHAFIFLSAIWAIWVVSTRRFKEGFYLFLWAVVPATIEIAMLTDFFRKGGMIWLKWGWIMEDQNPFLFFMTQWGFLIFLALLTLYDVITKPKKADQLLLYPGLALFAVCFYVVFAVWIVDNMKLMVWCYLLIFPVMGRVFRDRIRPVWRYPLYVLFFFSGFLAVFLQYRAENTGTWIASRKEMDGVCEATKNIPISERFAAMQIYNHPVALCGHPLAVGYGLYLWGHGIKASVQEEQLKRLMMGDKEWRALGASIGARYLFWGTRREEMTYPTSTRPWEKEAVRIAQGEWGAIYDLAARP